MNDYETLIRNELFGSPTDTVMRQYLAHFETDIVSFIRGLTKAGNVWEQYSVVANKREDSQEELVWSAAYFLNAINSALVSTRLFLSGFLVPSGNMARQALESVAFGVLLPFPKTGAYRDWKEGRVIEHKAFERLSRNADHCGVERKSVQALMDQAQWFDHYSHPSRMTLSAILLPPTDEYPHGQWNIGAQFVEQHLDQYRKEMGNRISLADLLTNTIAGTHTALITQGLIDRPIGIS